ncbi:hypothetical protein TNCV_12111 [Trichonephila clavipes]|nr:hypothetical protein TNCV_12111 [Trichonephila clavipes]
MRECRNGTAASSGTSNRRSRTGEKVQNCVNIRVSSPTSLPVTSDEFNYNPSRYQTLNQTSKTFGSTLYVETPRPLRGKLDPKLKRKPQQSNGGAVLASPNLKFSSRRLRTEA